MNALPATHPPHYSTSPSLIVCQYPHHKQLGGVLPSCLIHNRQHLCTPSGHYCLPCKQEKRDEVTSRHRLSLQCQLPRSDYSPPRSALHRSLFGPRSSPPLHDSSKLPEATHTVVPAIAPAIALDDPILQAFRRKYR